MFKIRQIYLFFRGKKTDKSKRCIIQFWSFPELFIHFYEYVYTATLIWFSNNRSYNSLKVMFVYTQGFILSLFLFTLTYWQFLSVNSILYWNVHCRRRKRDEQEGKVEQYVSFSIVILFELKTLTTFSAYVLSWVMISVERGIHVRTCMK